MGSQFCLADGGGVVAQFLQEVEHITQEKSPGISSVVF